MILVFVINANTEVVIEKPKLKERVLAENIVFMHPESHDSETQEIRQYFEDIKNKSLEDSEAIVINSILNSDKSQTTGNHDKIEKIEYLLPNFDLPTSNTEKQEQSLKHHQFLDNMTMLLSPDFFDEDPKMFLGDHDSYFKIVKKRSILFFYVSRVVLYLTIVMIIFRFIENKDKRRQVDASIYDKRAFQCTMLFQLISLAVIISGGVVFFYWIAEPKAIIDDAGSNLIFEFRKINVTSHEISEEIDAINNEKIKIPIDKFGIFQITNTIQYSLSKIDEDVNLAADFSHNMLKNPYLTNYSVSLTIFFNGFLLLGISVLSIIKMNPTFQSVLFYLSGISLSLTIYTMGMFFANYSGFHDICNSIINVNSRPKMPEQGIGLIRYVGCSQENIFFQQMYIILKAQNSAKKLFNNEMFKIHRPFVNGPEEALRISNYLKTIDASSVNITSFADILNRNKELLYKLQTIYNCNLIKSWLVDAESTLCYDGSYALLKIFWVLCVVCLAFVLLMLTANKGSKLLTDYQNIEIVKQLNLKKKRYANEILIE